MVESPPPFTYTAFGLHWHSPDLPLRELPLAEQAGAPESLVTLCDETGTTWPDLPPGPHDNPTLKMGPMDLRFTVQGKAGFRITGGDRIAWQRHDDTMSDLEISALALSSGVGAALIQRGLLVLHGNALAKEGRAIVCLGRSGAGKSTLAYALMQQGWQLLADDLVVISAEGRVLPGIPRIQLWQDAAKAFGLDPDSLPRIRRRVEKFVVMGPSVQRALQPVPLQAFYVIQERPPQGSEADQTAILPIQSQKEAALHLRTQTFQHQFVRGMGMEARHFLSTAQLQGRVPMATLLLPQGIDSLLHWLERHDLLRAAGRPAHGTA
ncbi:MAG: hypothetical protein VKN56_06480 [Cyanobacteriota bacterium]|nr:hypothetical protein [Cyanobacteriota bacterium]